MKNWLKVSLLSLNLLSAGSFACDIHGHSGFMPENNLRIPVGEKSAGGINEIQFNRVMDKMTALFSSAVAKTGKRLVIERRWTDATVNAYAHQETPGADTIVMFGGLARHPETTEDAMALVACHELGHHLGGAPRKVDSRSGKITWAANEGQSDYWGTMKCLRRYFENDDNVAAMRNVSVPANVISSCKMIYSNANEIASCMRTSMAGLALGNLLNSLDEGKVLVSFTTPDSSVVAKTFDDHPAAQCRLDTYYQASLCDHGFDQPTSMTDANTGVCSVRNGDRIGNRPTCWYKE